ncbi:MAG TPA: chloride channel protein, partial [Planctomycetota bacterium]|nr:chloride channel protein [Planctomycetota bacterium]
MTSDPASGPDESGVTPDARAGSMGEPVLSARSRRRSLQGQWQRARGLLELLVPEGPGLEMQLMGRTLLHAALVGLLAGLLGTALFAALEGTQHLLLERGAGLLLLRAAGEHGAAELPTRTFRPWLIIALPTLGALLAGLVMRRTPVTRGGGGDAMIEEFHHGVDDAPGRASPLRVLVVKGVASILTLGSGGAGGREGPTMQMGGALGLLVGRLLHLERRERRLLLVAGVAAGISAVFRTPLGAALLAIEVLYRD